MATRAGEPRSINDSVVKPEVVGIGAKDSASISNDFAYPGA